MEPISWISLAVEFLPQLTRWAFGDDADATATADAAVAAVRSVTGAETPAQALEALSDPQKVSALRVQLAQIASAREAAQQAAYLAQMRAVLVDVANARQHDLAYLSSGRTNWRANALVGLGVVGIVACVLALVLGGIDGDTAVGGFIISVGTTFANKIGTVFDFEFGSSRTTSPPVDRQQ